MLRKEPFSISCCQNERENETIKTYDLIKKNRIDCTLVTHFCHDLPKALTMWKTQNCSMSFQEENLSNIPLEVSWAKDGGGIFDMFKY